MSEENKSRLYGAIWHHMDAATIAGFGPWVRHADHVAEIERLRAKLAEAEAKKISLQDDVVPGLIKRAEAAEKRLASAKEVIAPFAESGRGYGGERGWIDSCKPSDFRAAAEWMEKGDE